MPDLMCKRRWSSSSIHWRVAGWFGSPPSGDRVFITVAEGHPCMERCKVHVYIPVVYTGSLVVRALGSVFEALSPPATIRHP